MMGLSVCVWGEGVEKGGTLNKKTMFLSKFVGSLQLFPLWYIVTNCCPHQPIKKWARGQSSFPVPPFQI